ncbi:MAG: hypothetical protein ACTSSH_04715 [Candidatus Heimdallarchaeota archaeon]
MIEIYTLVAGIVLCLLGIMMLVWTKNFIVLRYKGFHKLIRKQEIEVKYKNFNLFFAILYFVIAIPLVTIAIIEFATTTIPITTFYWIYGAVAVVGVAGILFANISKQFIQPLDITTETD